jgi:hypothetical protein
MYINWNAGDVAATMAHLAQLSIGQARSEMTLAAAEARADSTLSQGEIANHGSVEAVARAPDAGKRGRTGNRRPAPLGGQRMAAGELKLSGSASVRAGHDADAAVADPVVRGAVARAGQPRLVALCAVVLAAVGLPQVNDSWCGEFVW